MSIEWHMRHLNLPHLWVLRTAGQLLWWGTEEDRLPSVAERSVLLCQFCTQSPVDLHNEPTHSCNWIQNDINTTSRRLKSHQLPCRLLSTSSVLTDPIATNCSVPALQFICENIVEQFYYRKSSKNSKCDFWKHFALALKCSKISNSWAPLKLIRVHL